MGNVFGEILNAVELAILVRKGAAWVVENPPRVPLLTYQQAVEYFVHERPDDPKLSSGVLMRRNSPKGIEIIQVFLDLNKNLICHPDGTPFGQKILAREIDRELKGAFGEKDMILVK